MDRYNMLTVETPSMIVLHTENFEHNFLKTTADNLFIYHDAYNALGWPVTTETRSYKNEAIHLRCKSSGTTYYCQIRSTN